MLSVKFIKGQFAIFFSELCKYEDMFLNYTRISEKTDELLEKCLANIRDIDTNKACIGNEKQLLLDYLGNLFFLK